VAGCGGRDTLVPQPAVDGGSDGSNEVGADAAPEAQVDAPAEAAPIDAGPGGFIRIVRGGIDDRLNGYPWAMELFDGDRDGTPEVYVGTVQNPLCLQVGLAELIGQGQGLPPERWQCRNDLWGDWAAFFAASTTPGHVYRGTRDEAAGTFSWQRVFSPDASETIGFRGARVFDGALYILGTAQAGAVVWKSTDGASFERASPPDLVSGGIGVAGGLRGTQVFNGKLYVANNGAAEVFASSAPSASPGSWQQVNSTGFVASGGEVDGQGNPLNGAIWQLGVFGEYLYAGTTNLEGAELWKSDDPKPGNWTRVIRGGFGNTVPQGFMTIRPFEDHLYLGTVLYPVGAAAMEGCDILRVNANDDVELLVGKTRNPGGTDEIAPLSDLAGGFDYSHNVYAWYSIDYEGSFYVGTYDVGSQVIDYAEEMFGIPQDEWPDVLREGIDARLGTTDRERQGGADLWRTPDGVHWEPVNLDGFGDRDNYGIRNMLVTPWGLMVGTGNAVDGFEIWLKPR